MAWLFLILAGFCEIIWAAGLKAYGLNLSRGGIFTLATILLSLLLLSRAMRTLPLGTSYAVWTGIGAVGTVLWGIIYLKEPRDLPRIICVSLIVIGIVGLKLTVSAPMK